MDHVVHGQYADLSASEAPGEGQSKRPAFVLDVVAEGWSRDLALGISQSCAKRGAFISSNDGLMFSFPAGQHGYLVQLGNTSSFVKPPKAICVELNPNQPLKVTAPEVINRGTTLDEGCQVFLIAYAADGRLLGRKSLSLSDPDERVVMSFGEATRISVALRMSGAGLIDKVTLVFDTSTAERKPAAVASGDKSPGVDLYESWLVAAFEGLHHGNVDMSNALKKGMSGVKEEHRALHVARLANLMGRNKSYHVEADILEWARRHIGGPNTTVKLIRALFRSCRYAELAALLDVIDTNEIKTASIDISTTRVEIAAAARVSEVISVSFSERYRVPRSREKIAYCVHNALPYASGGYATRTHGLLKGIVTEGVDASVYCRPGFPGDVISGVRSQGNECRKIDSVSYVFSDCTARPGKLFRYFEEAGEYYTKRFEDDGVSIVHAASNFYTGIPALYAATRLGVPFVYEVRGLWELTRESRDPGYAGTALYRRNLSFERMCATRADHVFTLTSSMRDIVVEWGVPRSRVSLVPNAVDGSMFVPRPRDEYLQETLQIQSRDVVIGYIGSFVDYEGLENLITVVADLMRHFSQLKMVLVGDDAPAGGSATPVMRNLRRLVEEADLGERIKFTGRVPHDEIERYYSLMDVCPFPRLPVPVCEVVSPMKPLEAMAMAKCVVVSSVSGMSGMVEHNRTGVVYQKGSNAALREALARVILDEGLRNRLGERAREYVLSNRTWTKMGRDVGKHYARVCLGKTGFSGHPRRYQKSQDQVSATIPFRSGECW